MKTMLMAALAAFLGLGAAHAAEPGASDWAGNEAGRVRLVSATRAGGDLASLKLGVEFRLNEGWKIYWRTPGDAGYPPRFSWDGSRNLGEVQVSWPAPKRFELAGLQNHGYAGQIILPLDAKIAEPGKPVRVQAHVDYLACAKICVPMQAAVALDLPAGPAAPSDFVHELGRFTALVPGDGARHGMKVEKLEAVGSGDQSALRLTISGTEPFDHPDMFIEPAELASFEAPKIRMEGNRAILEARVTPGSLQRPLDAGPVTVTLADGIRSLEATLTPVPGQAAPEPGGGLAAMLAVALLGGLILNLMPCVLPVLSIKLLGALGHGGAERAHIRGAFLASAAGIVASFLALAGFAIAIKATGATFGWGIQFQQPAFLAAMVALLALFAANLWGIFEIRLPSALMNVGAGGAHHTLLGHFLSGAFATLLATPCSAPFVGTALGFALARGPVEIAAIFAALGLGMAVPFLAVAAWPDAARRLPKPGAWMLKVRKVLALALGGTALWLLSVLAVQTGPWGALLTGGAMVAAIIVLVLLPRMPERSRSAALVAVAALALGAVAAPYQADLAEAESATEEAGITWLPFDEAVLARLVAEDKVVFVDVTADWCITCKVNKKAVVERGEVAKRLGSGQVVAMRADWTRPDDRIARFLAGFDRYGIPFNVVYGPGARSGIALPELLTETEVLSALDRASRS